MYPTPTPGPMVPRPAPTPSAMALPALRPIASFSATVAARVVMTVRSTAVSCDSLVRLGDRAAEVDRSQGGEDEGLEGRDQPDLEEEEGDRHRAGDRAEDDGAEDGQVEQDDETAAHEEDEQVAGEDVREQSD